MSRTTISRAVVAAAAIAVLAWPGCSKRYARKPLARDGPVGREVRAMAAAVRSAGPGGLDPIVQQQGASGLTGPQARSLRAALLQVATCQEVEVEDLSQFGRDVYRASLRLRWAGGTSSRVCMLLVRSDGQLRWAGPN